MDKLEFADGRVEVSGYAIGEDVVLNINVDGVCVHQIRLAGLTADNLDVMLENMMVRPHVVPFGRSFFEHLEEIASKV